MAEYNKYLDATIITNPTNRMEGTIQVPSFRDLDSEILIARNEMDFIDGVVTLTPSTFMLAKVKIPATRYIDAEVTVARRAYPSIDAEFEIIDKPIESFIGAELLVSIPCEDFIEGRVIISPDIEMIVDVDIEESFLYVEGIPPTDDFSVREDQPYINYGTQDELVFGPDIGTTFESYLRWNIDIIPKVAILQSAKMYFHLTRRVPGGATLYLCEASNSIPSKEGLVDWSETGTTWLNRPGIGNVVAQLNVPEDPTLLEIDLLDYVQDWITAEKRGSRSFTLVLASGNSLITFGSRESDYYSPKINIEYYLMPLNPGANSIDAEITIAAHDDSTIPGSINVPKKPVRRYIDGSLEIIETSISRYLDAEITVKRSIEDLIDGELSIVNKTSSDDLEGDILIRSFTADYLEGSLVLDPDLSYIDLPGDIKVRVFDSVYLDGSITIGKIQGFSDIDGEIIVSVKDANDLPAEVEISKKHRDIEIDGNIYVSIPEELKSSISIEGELHIPKKKVTSTIDAEAFIRARYDSFILGEVELVSKAREDSIPGFIFVRAEDFSDLEAEFLIDKKSKEELLDASISVRENGFDYLPVELFVRAEDAIPGSIDVVLASMLDGEILVKSPYLDGEITVSIRVSDYIDGFLIPRIPAVDVLDAEIYIFNDNFRDLPGELFIPNIIDSSIPGEVEVVRDDKPNLEITLDTTPPKNVRLTLSDTETTLLNPTFKCTVETDDVNTYGYEMRINCAEAVIFKNGTTAQGMGEWIPYEKDVVIRPHRPGIFRVTVELRDDVWNASQPVQEIIYFMIEERPNYLNLTLDTTAPVVDITLNDGNQFIYTSDLKFNFISRDADVHEIKIWGDFRTGLPNFGNTEETSSWIPFSSEIISHCTTSLGEKNFFIKVRDDVWNESYYEAAVTLDSHKVEVLDDQNVDEAATNIIDLSLYKKLKEKSRTNIPDNDFGYSKDVFNKYFDTLDVGSGNFYSKMTLISLDLMYFEDSSILSLLPSMDVNISTSNLIGTDILLEDLIRKKEVLASIDTTFLDLLLTSEQASNGLLTSEKISFEDTLVGKYFDTFDYKNSSTVVNIKLDSKELTRGHDNSIISILEGDIFYGKDLLSEKSFNSRDKETLVKFSSSILLRLEEVKRFMDSSVISMLSLDTINYYELSSINAYLMLHEKASLDYLSLVYLSDLDTSYSEDYSDLIVTALNKIEVTEFYKIDFLIRLYDVASAKYFTFTEFETLDTVYSNDSSDINISLLDIFEFEDISTAILGYLKIHDRASAEFLTFIEMNSSDFVLMEDLSNISFSIRDTFKAVDISSSIHGNFIIYDRAFVTYLGASISSVFLDTFDEIEGSNITNALEEIVSAQDAFTNKAFVSSDTDSGCENTLIFNNELEQRDILYFWERGYKYGKEKPNPKWNEDLGPEDINYPFDISDERYGEIIPKYIPISEDDNGFIIRDGETHTFQFPVGGRYTGLHRLFIIFYDDNPDGSAEFVVKYDHISDSYRDSEIFVPGPVGDVPNQYPSIYQGIIFSEIKRSLSISFKGKESFHYTIAINGLGSSAIKNWANKVNIYNPEYLSFVSKYVYDEDFVALDFYEDSWDLKIYSSTGCGLREDTWDLLPTSELEKFIYYKVRQQDRDLTYIVNGDSESSIEQNQIEIESTNYIYPTEQVFFTAGIIMRDSDKFLEHSNIGFIMEDAVSMWDTSNIILDVKDLEEVRDVVSRKEFAIADNRYGCENILVFNNELEQRNILYFWEKDYHYGPSSISPLWERDIVVGDADYPFIEGDTRYGEIIPFKIREIKYNASIFAQAGKHYLFDVVPGNTYFIFSVDKVGTNEVFSVFVDGVLVLGFEDNVPNYPLNKTILLPDSAKVVDVYYMEFVTGDMHHTFNITLNNGYYTNTLIKNPEYPLFREQFVYEDFIAKDFYPDNWELKLYSNAGCGLKEDTWDITPTSDLEKFVYHKARKKNNNLFYKIEGDEDKIYDNSNVNTLLENVANSLEIVWFDATIILPEEISAIESSNTVVPLMDTYTSEETSELSLSLINIIDFKENICFDSIITLFEPIAGCEGILIFNKELEDRDLLFVFDDFLPLDFYEDTWELKLYSNAGCGIKDNTWVLEPTSPLEDFIYRKARTGNYDLIYKIDGDEEKTLDVTELTVSLNDCETELVEYLWYNAFVLLPEISHSNECIIHEIPGLEYVNSSEFSNTAIAILDQITSFDVLTKKYFSTAPDIGIQCENILLFSNELSQRDILYFWEDNYPKGNRYQNPKWGLPMYPEDEDYPFKPEDPSYGEIIEYSFAQTISENIDTRVFNDDLDSGDKVGTVQKIIPIGNAMEAFEVEYWISLSTMATASLELRTYNYVDSVAGVRAKDGGFRIFTFNPETDGTTLDLTLDYNLPPDEVVYYGYIVNANYEVLNSSYTRERWIHPILNEDFVPLDFYEDSWELKIYSNAGCGIKDDTWNLIPTSDLEKFVYTKAKQGNLDLIYKIEGDEEHPLEGAIALIELENIGISKELFWKSILFTVYEDYIGTENQVLLLDSADFFSIEESSKTLLDLIETPISLREYIWYNNKFKVLDKFEAYFGNTLEIVASSEEAEYAESSELAIVLTEVFELEEKLLPKVEFTIFEKFTDTEKLLLEIPVIDEEFVHEAAIPMITPDAVGRVKEHGMFRFLFLGEHFTSRETSLLELDVKDETLAEESWVINIDINFRFKSRDYISIDKMLFLKDTGYVCFWTEVLNYPVALDWATGKPRDPSIKYYSVEFIRRTSCFGAPPGGWSRIYPYPKPPHYIPSEPGPGGTIGGWEPDPNDPPKGWLPVPGGWVPDPNDPPKGWIPDPEYFDPDNPPPGWIYEPGEGGGPGRWKPDPNNPPKPNSKDGWKPDKGNPPPGWKYDPGDGRWKPIPGYKPGKGDYIIDEDGNPIPIPKPPAYPFDPNDPIPTPVDPGDIIEGKIAAPFETITGRDNLVIDIPVLDWDTIWENQYRALDLVLEVSEIKLRVLDFIKFKELDKFKFDKSEFGSNMSEPFDLTTSKFIISKNDFDVVFGEQHIGVEPKGDILDMREVHFRNEIKSKEFDFNLKEEEE